MEVHQIEPEKVVVEPGRFRQKFERGALLRLEWSIKRLGQIEPGVCRRGKDDETILIAGERRLRACVSLGVPYSFVYMEDIEDKLLLREIELEENLHREELHWKEEVDAKEELKRIKEAQHGKATPGPGTGGFSMDDLAETLGESRGLVSQVV